MANEDEVVQRLIAKAHAEAAQRCDKLCRLMVPQWRRKAGIEGALRACDEMMTCEYWRELGFSSPSKYSLDRFDRYHLVPGLAAHFRLRDIIPHARELWNANILNPRKLAACGHLINPTNVIFWLPLLIHLKPLELRQIAARQARERRGLVGELVFVPLWIPLPWFKRYWAPRDEGQPAFQIIQAMIREAENAEQ